MTNTRNRNMIFKAQTNNNIAISILPAQNDKIGDVCFNYTKYIKFIDYSYRYYIILRLLSSNTLSCDDAFLCFPLSLICPSEATFVPKLYAELLYLL